MNAEDIRQWAREKSTTLDWGAFCRVFFEGEASNEDIEAMECAGLLHIEHGVYTHSGGLCWGDHRDKSDAMLAYLREVAEALTPNEKGDLEMVVSFVADGTFQGQSTNRHWPKWRARALCDKVLLDWKPMEQADADGFHLPNRIERAAYFPTSLGFAVARYLERPRKDVDDGSPKVGGT